MRLSLHLTVCVAVLCAFVVAPTAHRHERAGDADGVVHAHFSEHAHPDERASGPRLTDGPDTIAGVDVFLCTAHTKSPDPGLAAFAVTAAPEVSPEVALDAPRPSAHDPPVPVSPPLRAPPA